MSLILKEAFVFLKSNPFQQVCLEIKNSFPLYLATIFVDLRNHVSLPTANLVSFIIAASTCGGELIRRNKKKDFGRRYNRLASRYCMTYSCNTLSHFCANTSRQNRCGLTLQMADVFLLRANICMWINPDLPFFAYDINLDFHLVTRFLIIFGELLENVRKCNTTYFSIIYVFYFCTLRDILI